MSDESRRIATIYAGGDLRARVTISTTTNFLAIAPMSSHCFLSCFPLRTFASFALKVFELRLTNKWIYCTGKSTRFMNTIFPPSFFTML